MAFPKLSVLIITTTLVCYFHVHPCQSSTQNYTSIFSFGDSLADTGNLLISNPAAVTLFGRLPYGMTYFRRPTGRCSDGRLVVDFLAQAFGLPMLPPYLARGKNVRQGVNFAVAGATALDPAFFEQIGATGSVWTNQSLGIQLGWFEQLKPSLCSTTADCNEYFKKSLFLVGEIGGNDYNYVLFNGKSCEEAKSYVPKVVGAITAATEKLIKNGVVHLVVPGDLPIGCSAAYLTMFQSTNKGDYDSIGCLKSYNDFAKYHNAVLQQALNVLRRKYPPARIIYADYYGAAMSFIQNPKRFGFVKGALRTCCGAGGPYNFNPSASCGRQGSKVCQNPSAYANWDGFHLTEAAYHAIADNLLRGPYTSPRLVVN